MYVRDLERAKLGLGGLPDRTHLINAKCDLDSIIHVYPCLKTYLEMAQVCYYSGVDAVQELMLTDEDSINQALVLHARAMGVRPGRYPPRAAAAEGKVSAVERRELNAMESFKKSIHGEQRAP
ncbi:hypothetical protein GDO81_021374 [Engystomops pustulosus]|uniref:Uncharacterized protein n=1 Tax=Engystomops pustulosus TaxID=76066 RepID=A0AAV6ZJ90_ENGPU|nr:hypothetical protein GDO81_021374 [Engystomops pustulosus]